MTNLLSFGSTFIISPFVNIPLLPSTCLHMPRARATMIRRNASPAFTEFAVQQRGLDKKIKYYKTVLLSETNGATLGLVEPNQEGQEDFLGEGPCRLSPEWQAGGPRWKVAMGEDCWSRGINMYEGFQVAESKWDWTRCARLRAFSCSSAQRKAFPLRASGCGSASCPRVSAHQGFPTCKEYLHFRFRTCIAFIAHMEPVNWVREAMTAKVT